MSKCFLEGFGQCAGKITREHYVSETVLRAISNDSSIEIGGLPWLPPNELRRIGIGSLTTKALCERHNSGLADLDKAAGTLIRTFDAADKDPNSLPALTAFNGKTIERWLLKVLCGLTASGGLNNAVIPDTWKKLLVGGAWPAKWGLYVSGPGGVHVLAKEFYVETLIDPSTGEIKAAQFRIAGVHLTLLLGRPDRLHPWGHYRPRGIIFDYPKDESRRVEFRWRKPSDQAVVYSKIGVTTASAPQWDGWKRGEE